MPSIYRRNHIKQSWGSTTRHFHVKANRWWEVGVCHVMLHLRADTWHVAGRAQMMLRLLFPFISSSRTQPCGDWHWSWCGDQQCPVYEFRNIATKAPGVYARKRNSSIAINRKFWYTNHRSLDVASAAFSLSDLWSHNRVNKASGHWKLSRALPSAKFSSCSGDNCFAESSRPS